MGKATDILNILGIYKRKAICKICILWNDNLLHCIHVELNKALEHINDVTAVSFDTWLYNSNEKYVIEFHHEGRITIGIV